MLNANSASVIPSFRYRNASAAIEFLVQAFGFERRLVVPGESDRILHAQLTLGNGMVMLGSTPEGVVPQSAPVQEHIQSVYVIVDNPDLHYAHAKAAGATIVSEIETKEYGGRGYSCNDLEGNVWHFGDFDPWRS